MENKQPERFLLSEKAIENLGAALLLTVLGFIGYTMYTWLSTLAQ